MPVTIIDIIIVITIMTMVVNGDEPESGERVIEVHPVQEFVTNLGSGLRPAAEPGQPACRPHRYLREAMPLGTEDRLEDRVIARGPEAVHLLIAEARQMSFAPDDVARCDLRFNVLVGVDQTEYLRSPKNKLFIIYIGSVSPQFPVSEKNFC